MSFDTYIFIVQTSGSYYWGSIYVWVGRKEGSEVLPMLAEKLILNMDRNEKTYERIHGI
jgi:hypothetical protein